MRANRKSFYGYVKDRGSKETELYDLHADIGEKKNVAKDNPAVVSKLMAHIKAFKMPDKIPSNRIAL